MPSFASHMLVSSSYANLTSWSNIHTFNYYSSWTTMSCEQAQQKLVGIKYHGMLTKVGCAPTYQEKMIIFPNQPTLLNSEVPEMPWWNTIGHLKEDLPSRWPQSLQREFSQRFAGGENAPNELRPLCNSTIHGCSFSHHWAKSQEKRGCHFALSHQKCFLITVS